MGHSRDAAWGGEDEAASPDRSLDRETWQENRLYLYGIDLFNDGYWWEAHEVWERLWKRLDSQTAEARLLRALVQLAAARLKLELGERSGAARLAQRSRENLAHVIRASHASHFMGLGLESLRALVTDWPPVGVREGRDLLLALTRG